ncbi:hypothetical protein HOLleu_04355 [Holothuria leucospilota]|uniref:Uncharacterized protein n=1 Tax=Holothuria leucospilota TaxID=206669 RepID=A0A9Q1CTX8_HOLLE|nr:hypothetical protein HOLleu_04355 [Holothuria leucospilota]
MAVTSGASSTTLGGFFPIIVLSELAGLAARGVAGAAGVAGAGLSIVSPLENLVNDTNRLVLVKPALQKFVNMQKDLAGAVVFLAIVYEMIRSQEREKYFTNCTMAALRAFYRKIKKCVSTIEPFEVKLSNIKKMAEELVDISYLSQCKTEDTSLQAQSWWKEDMKKLTDKPFDYLENALRTILRGNKDVKSVPTFSTFIRHLFVSSNMTEECQVSYTNTTQRVHNYAQVSMHRTISEEIVGIFTSTPVPGMREISKNCGLCFYIFEVHMAMQVGCNIMGTAQPKGGSLEKTKASVSLFPPGTEIKVLGLPRVPI